MKKNILKACSIINIAMIIYVILIIIGVVLNIDNIEVLYKSEMANNLRAILVIPIFLLWIYDLILWSKNDRHIGRFILIVFFIGWYTPFYFLKALKQKWL